MPPNEIGPGTKSGTDQLAKADSEFTAPWRQDWNEPLTAEDRREAQVLAEAAELGYRLAVQCRCCGQWLTNPTSVRGFIGPVCRAKAAAG
jgi:Family of unknown function (DUF6011)